jgi:hypothetical protein
VSGAFVLTDTLSRSFTSPFQNAYAGVPILPARRRCALEKRRSIPTG